MNKFIKTEKIISILIDAQGEIYHSNIDKSDAQEYLKKIDIFNHLPVKSTTYNNHRYYTVTVDKVFLNNNQYYLICIQSHRKLYEYAYKDSITGLYNRNYWEQLKSGTLHRPMPKKFTLIIIDVDNLKYINDHKGHLCGDKAIKIVGQAIKESIRKHDIAIRYGGDEFLILLLNTNKAVIERVINRIKNNIRKKGDKENIQIEISAGAACSNCTYEMDKTITIADNKMYKEKARKKVKIRKIKDELTELKKKIKTLKNEVKSKANGDINEMVNKELTVINTKLEQMINKYSKNT